MRRMQRIWRPEKEDAWYITTWRPAKEQGGKPRFIRTRLLKYKDKQIIYRDRLGLTRAERKAHP